MQYTAPTLVILVFIFFFAVTAGVTLGKVYLSVPYLTGSLAVDTP